METQKHIEVLRSLNLKFRFSKLKKTSTKDGIIHVLKFDDCILEYQNGEPVSILSFDIYIGPNAIMANNMKNIHNCSGLIEFNSIRESCILDIMLKSVSGVKKRM